MVSKCIGPFTGITELFRDQIMMHDTSHVWMLLNMYGKSEEQKTPTIVTLLFSRFSNMGAWTSIKHKSFWDSSRYMAGIINWILSKKHVCPFHPYLTFAVLLKIVPCFVWIREVCGPPTDIPPSGLGNIFFFQHVKHPSCIINSVPLVINYEPWANLVLVAR